MATIVEGFDAKYVYADKKTVAIATSVDVEDWDTVMANARLIAAAPDLLEALRPFAEFACEPPCGCINCIARDAIAKAEGL